MALSPTLEIKKSKHGEYIPVLNGVFLHSAFNPIKEAESFVENHLTTLNQKNNILVLGLGFAYHLDQILHHMNNFHQQYQVVVVEPNHKILKACEEFNPKNLKRLVILSGLEVKTLYQDANFIRFLMNRPGVIAHPASFNFHSEYFKSLLSFEADQSLSSFQHRLPNELKAYFQQFNPNMTLNQIFTQLETKTKLTTTADFMLGALSTWTNNNTTKVDTNDKHAHC